MSGQKYRLLKYFISNDSLSMTDLTARFQFSEKTIKKYIAELNHDLNGTARICEQQQRLYLKVSDYQQLTTLQTKFLKQSLDFNDPQKRQAFIILSLIKTDDYITLDDLADQLTVSKGTLIRDIKYLKSRLLKYDTKIDSMTNNGIRLITKYDYNYGLLLLNFVYDYYSLSMILNYNNQKIVIENLVHQMDAADQTINLIKKNIVVLATLQQNKKRLKQPIPFYKEVVNKEKVMPLVNHVEQLLKTDLTQTEENFLLYPLNIKFTNIIKKRI